MMNNNPLVSIVIPVYNGSNYLADAIDSALQQTYHQIEVIVVNDGSTDNGLTRNIALKYGDKIRYFEKDNGGVSSALNKGMREMKGEFFSWLSHDDLFFPNKIQTQIDFISNNKDTLFLYSSYFFWNAQTGEKTENFEIAKLAKNNFFYQLMTGYPIHGCTTLISRKLIAKVGYFDETLRDTQDYDYWFRCALVYQPVFLDIPLIYSRLHPEQGSKIAANKIKHFECDEVFVRISRHIVSANIFDERDLVTCFHQMRKSGFYASATMLNYGIKNRMQAGLLFFYLTVFKLIYHDLFHKFLFYQFKKGISAVKSKKISA